MKINPSLVNQIYKKSQARANEMPARPHGEVSAVGTKMDTITISAEGSKQNSLSKLTQSIAAEVEAPIDAARLAQLRTAVEQQQYRVDTATLTDAILGRLTNDKA